MVLTFYIPRGDGTEARIADGRRTHGAFDTLDDALGVT
jgi:hypothetical protein